MSKLIGPEGNYEFSSDPGVDNTTNKTLRQGENLGSRLLLGSAVLLTGGVASQDNVVVPTGEYRTISANGVEMTQIFQGTAYPRITAEIFLDNYANFQEGKEAAKKFVEYFFQAYPLSEHLKDYDFWVRNPVGMENLHCGQEGYCTGRDTGEFGREIDRVISATKMIPQETFVLIKSNDQRAGGQGVVANPYEPPSIYNFVGVVLPTKLIAEDQMMNPDHEWGARMGFRDSTDQTSVMGNYSVRRFNDAETAQIERVFANNWVFNHLSPRLNARILGLNSLRDGIGAQSLQLTDLTLASLISVPEGTEQLKILISPAANKYTGLPDGRDIPIQWGSLNGVNLPLRESLSKTGLVIKQPVLGQGPYVALPDMTYTWKVCASGVMTPIPWNSEKWEEVEVWPGHKIHVPCQEFQMKTPPTDSTTIAPVSLANNMETNDLTPTLQWQNKRTNIFYYEVQLSSDPDFEMDPQKAKAAVYWNLIHGGETTPLNSWTVPDSAKLDPNQTYYWRVRPRVQGDGVEVAWSPSWSFKTASDARVQAMSTDFTIFRNEDGSINWSLMQADSNRRLIRDAQRSRRPITNLPDFVGSPLATVREFKGSNYSGIVSRPGREELSPAA